MLGLETLKGEEEEENENVTKRQLLLGLDYKATFLLDIFKLV